MQGHVTSVFLLLTLTSYTLALRCADLPQGCECDPISTIRCHQANNPQVTAIIGTEVTNSFINVDCEVNGTLENFPAGLRSVVTSPVLKASISNCPTNATYVQVLQKLTGSDLKLTELVVYDKRGALENLHRKQFTELTDLIELSISNTRLASLSMDLFMDLQKLKHLKIIENSILQNLPSMLFKSQSNLEYLDLSRNALKEIHKDLFSSLTKLTYLDLSYNILSSFNENTFSSLTDLAHLQLNDNNLNSLDLGLFSDLSNLKYLELKRNQIKSLPDLLFKYNVNLVKLGISHNQVAEVRSEVFANLTKLEKLDLSHNLISEISQAKLLSKLNVTFFYL